MWILYTAYTLLAALSCAFVGWFVAWAAVFLLAKSKGHSFSVEPFSLLRLSSFSFGFSKGFVSHVGFEELRIFRDANWSQTFKSWFRDSLFPVYLRGPSISINLQKLGPQEGLRLNKPRDLKASRRSNRLNPYVWKIILSWMSALIKLVVPKIPISVHDVRLRIEDVGIAVVIPNIALLFQKHKKSSELEAALMITEIVVQMDCDTDSDPKAITLGKLTNSTLKLNLSRKRGALPHVSVVNINLDDLYISLPDKFLDVVVNLAARAGNSPTPKHVQAKGKSKQNFYKLINLLPGEVGFCLSRVSIDICNQSTIMPKLVTLSFCNLHFKSERDRGGNCVHAQNGISNVEIKGGVSYDEQCAVAVAFPNITTDLTLEVIENQDGNPVCLSGAVDIQGMKSVVEGETIQLFLSEGGKYLQECESKFTDVYLSKKKSVVTMSDDVDVSKDSPRKTESLKRPPENSISAGDVLQEETIDLPTGKEYSESIQGKQHCEGASPPVDVDLEPAGLHCEESEGSLHKTSPFLSKFSCKCQVKISALVTIELRSQGPGQKLSFCTGSLWAEVSQEVENGGSGPVQKASMGFSSLQIQLAPVPSIQGYDDVANIVGLDHVSMEVSSAIGWSSQHCEAVLNLNGTVKGLATCLSPSAIHSSISLASYYLNQLAILEKLVSTRRPSKPKKNQPLGRQFKLGSWRARIEDVAVVYNTIFIPVEAFSAERCEVPYSVKFSVESFDAEPWEHWTGGQSVVQNVKVEMYPSSETGEIFTLLSLHKLHAKLEDRGGPLGLQLIGNDGAVNVKIDAAFVLMNIALEMGSVIQKLADFKKAEVYAAGPPKDSISLEQAPGKKMSFNVCLHDIKIGIAIGDMDHVSAVILEAHTDTRPTIPRVYVKQVDVFMNDSQLLSSKHLSIVVNPPMPLGALEDLHRNSSLPKRSTFVRSRDKEHTTEVCAVPEADNLGFEQVEVSSSTDAQAASGWGATRVSSTGSFLQRESGNLSIASTMGSADITDDPGVDDPMKSSESQCILRRRKALANLDLLSHAEQTTEEQNMDILQIEMEMDSVCVILPHDQHVGRLIMFTELWVDAVKQVILHYVKQLKKFAQKLDSSPPAKGHAAPPALVEVAIKSNSLSFRVEAHPLEAWLALNGRLLRSIVMQRQVWQSAIGSAFSDDEDPDHGPGSGEAAKEWIMHKLFEEYYQKSNLLKAQCASDLHHRGALMSIVSGEVDAMILVGEKSNLSVFQACVNKIREIDKPASDDVLFSKAQPIHLDGKLSNVTAHFGGLHAAHISEIGLSGSLVRGRQLTHRPKLETAVFKVGEFHRVPMGLPIKGARPPMKAYTQLSTTISGMKAQASIGLEPIWAQMAVAFNRLTPPSEVHSDGRVKDPGATLQPWDKIRNMWRGSMGICIRQMKAAFAATIDPVVTAQSDRVELDADELDIQVRAGQIDMHAVGMQVTMFMTGLRSGPEQDLHVLPLGLLPNAVIKFEFNWLMPNGRSHLDHYAYPRVFKPDEHILLDPVNLTNDFVGEGYTFSISAKLDGDMGSVEKVADVPHVTLGEAQIRFLVDFVKLMENAPVHIRGCWRRGTYFVKKKKKTTVGLELPNLLHRLQVSASSGPVEIRHHTLEPDDPSSDMLVCCEMVRFAGAWGFLRNIDIASRRRAGDYTPEPRWKEVEGVWRRTQGPKIPPDMETLEVEAFQIQGFLPDKHATNPLLNRTRLEAKHNSFLLHLLKQKSSRREASENMTAQPTGTEGHILSASCFWLRQLGGPGSSRKDLDVQVTLPSGRKKRPLKIMMEDVKVLVPVEVRNAILGVFMHMSSAFTGPPQSHSADVGDKPQPMESTGQVPLQEESSHDLRTDQANRESSFVRALLEQGSEISASDILLAEKSSSLQMIDPPPEGSKMVLELEFVHVQLGLVSDISEGAVLLTLNSGRLHEHLDDQNHIRTLGLTVDHVQCYAMDTSIDPLNPVRWLEVSDGCLAIPSDSTGILTTIVQPFRVQMSDTFLLFKAQALNPGRAAEELKLKSPLIEATTESGQFEILVDVINSVATPPLPDISLLRDRILGASISALEDTNEEIQEAKRMLRAEYIEFNAKRQEVFDVWCSSGEGFAHSLGALLFTNVTPIRDKFANDSGGLEPVSGFSEFVKSFPQPEGGSMSECDGKDIQLLLYAFLNEQIEAARMHCLKSALHLSETRKENEEKNKHKKLFKSMSMSFAVDDVSWSLRKDGADFIQAQIRGVTYSSFQNKDLSGESKVSVLGMCLVDAEGVISATPGLNQGIVLSALNPQGPGEEILRGLAVRGGQTSSHVYYEHIEVWVHPLGLHFTERLARDLAAYFFGADEADLHKEQEEFVRGVEHSTRTLERFSSIGSNSGSEGEPSPETSLPQDRPQASGADSTSQKRLSASGKHASQGDPLESLMEIKSPVVKERKKKGLARRRKVHFVHVRFNKVTTQITYEGRPFPISNLDIIIRMNEYNNVVGHFHDILRKYRNNCITSVLKSAGSFLGRRYDPEEDFGENSRKKRSVKDRLIDRIRKGKSSIVGAVEGVVEGVVDMATSKELQKEEKAKKMILGEP